MVAISVDEANRLATKVLAKDKFGDTAVLTVHRVDLHAGLEEIGDAERTDVGEIRVPDIGALVGGREVAEPLFGFKERRVRSGILQDVVHESVTDEQMEIFVIVVSAGNGAVKAVAVTGHLHDAELAGLEESRKGKEAGSHCWKCWKEGKDFGLEGHKKFAQAINPFNFFQHPPWAFSHRSF